MTNYEPGRPQSEDPDYQARLQYPEGQGYGQSYGQPPWRPDQYDPEFHQQRLTGDQHAQPRPGYQPQTGYQPPGGPPPRRPRRKRHWVLWSLGGFVALIVIIIAASSNHNNPVNSRPAAQASSVPASPANPCAKGLAPDANGVCRPGGITPTLDTSVAPAPSSAPASPAMTVSQQQAVDAAQGYLAMGSGFSYYSLEQQLTSSYGDGFSQADAKFAINYLHPDWDAQAVDAAKGYLAMGGFSCSSLEQQLTSSYGDGFTQTQADYAAHRTMGC